MTIDKHPCCKTTQKQASLRSYLAAILAVFLACLCCSLPLLPLMLGLSGSSSLLGLTKYHQLFDVFGSLIVLGSVAYIWHEHKATEQSVYKSRRFWTCLVITFAMYGGMTFVVKQLIFPKIYPMSSTMHIHENH